MKYFVLVSVFLTSLLFASDADFTLPIDKTQWQKAATDYMQPVLSTPEIEKQWSELLNLTMPTHGNFDPIKPERRAQTIIQSRLLMEDKTDGERLSYLTGLMARHKHYIGH